MQKQVESYEPLIERVLQVAAKLSNAEQGVELTKVEKKKKIELIRTMLSYQELESILDRYEDNSEPFDDLSYLSVDELVDVIIERLKIGALELNKLYTDDMEEKRRKRLQFMSK